MQRAKTLGSNFLEAFNRRLPDQSRADQIRSAAAGLALVFILLPWMPAGPTGSMTGSRLLGYSLFNDAVGGWFRENAPGATLFVLVPTLTICLAFYAFVAIIRGRNPVKSHLFIAFMPIITLWVASHPMLDRPPSTLLGLPMPQIGLLHMVVIHLGLLLYGLYLRFWSRWFSRQGNP